MPSLWRCILLQPTVFALRFHARRLYWRATGIKISALQSTEEIKSSFVREKALPYNLGNRWIINRARTERLVWLMRAIQGFQPEKARMLVVGPRNEAELLLLKGHGFKMSNLSAIDLFSYSPTVTLMDMHSLTYADNSFDAVYSSFVITYSDDIPTAIRETIRVARDGAIIIFAFEHLKPGLVNKLGASRLQGGPSELLSLFGPAVDKVYWSEDYERGDSYVASALFRLRKSAAVASQ
jgi:SAM-dependent methyltransferase